MQLSILELGIEVNELSARHRWHGDILFAMNASHRECLRPRAGSAADHVG
jgi:hypothetical protein